MSIVDARAGYCDSWAGGNFKRFTDRELLEKARDAIRSRRVLIHGKLVDGSRVCAVGAVAQKFGDFRADSKLLTELQEFNDSMPKVSPETRRDKVLAWVRKRLKELDV